MIDNPRDTYSRLAETVQSASGVSGEDTYPLRLDYRPRLAHNDLRLGAGLDRFDETGEAGFGS